jgi:hypothetical protein
MPIPDADIVKDKVSEAEFFLDKATEVTGDEFRYYLSAHLNAVYSIDDIVSSDFTDFEDWSERDADQRLHNVLLDNRHSLTHLGKPTEGDGNRPYLWEERVSDMDDREAEYKPRRNEGQDMTFEYYFKYGGHFTDLAPAIAEHYGTGMNVCEICGIHLRRVEEWVNDWEAQRGS